MDATKPPENLNNQLETALESLSRQMTGGIESGKYTMAEIKAVLREKSTRVAQTTQDYVQQNPWKLIAIGGLAGLSLGIWMRRVMN